jgi:hypothetical protein
MKLISKALILLIFFLSTAAAQDAVPIEKNEGVITNVVSSFVFYEDYFELWAAFPEYAGKIEALSFCAREPEVNMAWCTIHVVEPQILDGEHTLSLGHEVMHGIWGVNFHTWFLDDEE